MLADPGDVLYSEAENSYEWETANTCILAEDCCSRICECSSMDATDQRDVSFDTFKLPFGAREGCIESVGR